MFMGVPAFMKIFHAKKTIKININKFECLNFGKICIQCFIAGI